MPELPYDEKSWVRRDELGTDRWFLPDRPLRKSLDDLLNALGNGEDIWESFRSRLLGHAEAEYTREVANRISSDLKDSPVEDMPLLLLWEADELDRILAAAINDDPASEIARLHSEFLEKFEEMDGLIYETMESLDSLRTILYSFDAEVAKKIPNQWTDLWNRTDRNIGYMKLILDIYFTVQRIVTRGEGRDGQIKEVFSQYMENFDNLIHGHEPLRDSLAEFLEPEFEGKYVTNLSLSQLMQQAEFFVGVARKRAKSAKPDESGEHDQPPPTGSGAA